MVTDFIAESEPLRGELRTVALSLLGKVRRLAARATEMDQALVDDILCLGEDAGVLVTLGGTIGLISAMNGSIIVSELEKNATRIKHVYGDKRSRSVTQPGATNVALAASFFDVPEPVMPSAPMAVSPVQSTNFSKGQNVQKSVLYTGTIEAKRKPDNQSRTGSVGIKIARRNDVLNVVRSKGQVSIKDILSIIKDISEKTVQRELLGLVKEGVLQKEGEKRWSTYKLVS